MRGEAEVIEENIEELVSLLAEHTHSSIQWDVRFMEQLVEEIQINLKRLRRFATVIDKFI